MHERSILRGRPLHPHSNEDMARLVFFLCIMQLSVSPLKYMSQKSTSFYQKLTWTKNPHHFTKTDMIQAILLRLWLWCWRIEPSHFIKVMAMMLKDGYARWNEGTDMKVTSCYLKHILVSLKVQINPYNRWNTKPRKAHSYKFLSHGIISKTLLNK